MTGKTFQFDFSNLKLTVDQIETVLGYREGESHEGINGMIKELLKEAGTLCSLKAEYRIFENISFSDTAKTLKIGGTELNIGKIIFGQIKKADAVALFVCSAGEAIGERSRSAMKKGDFPEGYIFDVIGSEAVESAADLMQDDLEKELIISGLNITNRFSPGYCGWNVSEQHKLFSLIPYNFCGIRLTESALMDPIKSVSGIIGIGKNVRRLPYTCSICDMKDCIYRRKA